MRTWLTILVTIVITFVISFVTSAQNVSTPQERAIIKVWNECGDSIDRENSLSGQLNTSMHLNPPWRVVDAREPLKRAKIIDKMILELKARIRLLERIKEQDGQ